MERTIHVEGPELFKEGDSHNFSLALKRSVSHFPFIKFPHPTSKRWNALFRSNLPFKIFCVHKVSIQPTKTRMTTPWIGMLIYPNWCCNKYWNFTMSSTSMRWVGEYGLTEINSMNFEVLSNVYICICTSSHVTSCTLGHMHMSMHFVGPSLQHY